MTVGRVLRGLFARKSVRVACAAAAGLGIVAVILAWRTGYDRAAVEEFWGRVRGLVQAHPWALFLALVVLPGLPFPVSALLVAAGVVWHEHPVIACLVSLVALSLNMTWTYWLAAGPARRLVERLAKAFGMQLPDLPRKDHVRLILVLRLTPGVPLFFQNYLLGVMRPPFRLYLPLSILLSAVMSSGLVLVGAGATDGRFAPAVTGIALVVVGITLTRWLRAWLERRKAAAAEPDPAAEI